jgi:hypothetical protein
MPATKLNTYADVQAMFNTFVANNGIDITDAPHQDFWSTDYKSFVTGNVPGVDSVPILVKGNADQSNLVQILKGAIRTGGASSRCPWAGRSCRRT